jgi:group I intron endonuclease
MKNYPIHSYLNADTQKIQICLDNKGKTSIYKWTNLISGKSYVGSSINLSNRYKDYLNSAFLTMCLKKGRSIICNALLKHGYSGFKL